MIICFVCHSGVYGTLTEYLVHLKSQHARFSHYDTYSCRQGQCCRTFTNKYTFMKHLRKSHSEDFTNCQQTNAHAAFNLYCQDVSSNCLMENDSDPDDGGTSEQSFVNVEGTAKRKFDVRVFGAHFIA